MRRYWIFVVPTILIYLIVWTNLGGKTRTSDHTEASQGSVHRDISNASRSKHVAMTLPKSKPKFSDALLSGNRPSSKKLLTIAIPTISRPMGIIYIQSTLDSLIKNSNETERRDVIIVILLADFNETSRTLLNAHLVTTYRKFFDSGLIQTIQAPRTYYPSFKNLKQTYNHEIDKVKWRSKQNFDYAFMMEYSECLSEYYLQLEDDVVTVPQYLFHIKAFMSQIPRWTCLEFCELGFIAKFYHSYDLEKLATFLKLFFNEQPNDVIYLHFNELMLQYRRFVRRPTIFQHKGMVSSLGLKRDMLEDILFDDKHQIAMKDPQTPVEVRQLGRVAGPEYVVWVKRRQQEALLKRKLYQHPT